MLKSNKKPARAVKKADFVTRRSRWASRPCFLSSTCVAERQDYGMTYSRVQAIPFNKMRFQNLGFSRTPQAIAELVYVDIII